jgi:AcrR family transcriptional regulator
MVSHDRPGKSGPQTALRRRHSPKGEGRREAILSAAMQRFAEDGYQSASFAAIAEDVGLSLPGLLHYYPSKVHLLLALLDRRDMETSRTLEGAKLPWRPFLEGLTEVVRRNMEMVGIVRTFVILNAESLTRDHPAEEWFRQRTVLLRNVFSEVLAEGVAAGEIRPHVVPDEIASELIAVMDGLQIQWLRDPQQVDMSAIFSSYVARLAADIAVR